MAQKPSGSEEGGKTILLAGLVCVFLALAWGAYELLREPTEDEKKAAAENAKIEAEKARRNAPKAP